MIDEFFECERTVKAHPDFQAALRKRGITNLDLVMVDPWSAGNYGTNGGRFLTLKKLFNGF
jgi:primary-amine oxidase